jgi:plastocyanin
MKGSFRFLTNALLFALLIGLALASLVSYLSAGEPATALETIAPSSATPGGAHVAIIDFDFVPDLITITVGTEVSWSNEGSVIHQIKSGELPSGKNCTYGSGYWRRHLDNWPIAVVTLGGHIYAKEEASAILERPPQGDATYLLARRLIPAKLNVAQGADPNAIINTIVAADEWLMQHPLGSSPRNPERRQGLQLAEILENFNSGLIGPGSCPSNSGEDTVVLSAAQGSPGDGEWDSGPLHPGETFSFLFDVAGVYDYYNPFYPQMRGRIIVDEDVPSSPTWQQAFTGEKPLARGEYAAAYDVLRQTIALYGGNADGWPYENSTWKFDGANWTPIDTSIRPPAVYGAAMVYDRHQDAMVLFGGSNSEDSALAQT